MNTLGILFIGDIIGKPGLDMLRTWMAPLQNKYKPDLIIVNGENAADGKGCTEKEGEVIFGLGAHVITGGNHTWDRPQSQEYLKTKANVLRPQNYPRGTHGTGHCIVEAKNGKKVAILNLQGRTFMATIDCPFRSAEYVISKVKSETNIIFIDVHAEATAEKMALAHFLDGKVSAIVGTHTHVQTADERILPGGTAFITDVGMTGPYESVIGMKTVAAINRFIYQTPQKYETAQNEVHLCGIYCTVDTATGKAVSIERIILPEFEKEKDYSSTESRVAEKV